VDPLKGQILRLRAPGPPLACALSWEGNYAATRPDGLIWAGTTEEQAGFDEQPTPAGRDAITRSLLRMAPSLAEAEVVQQTACLRPLSADGLPIIGEAPGWEGVYLATGGGRKGILLSAVMGRIIADLILKGETPLPVAPFAPGRFAKTAG
jgi:glycine oxidase